MKDSKEAWAFKRTTIMEVLYKGREIGLSSEHGRKKWGCNKRGADLQGGSGNG